MPPSTASDVAPYTEDLLRMYGQEFIRSALCLPGHATPEFSDAQLTELFACLSCVPMDKLPQRGPGCIDITMQRYHYLTGRFAELNRRAEEQQIRNRYAYLLAMLKADCAAE